MKVHRTGILVTISWVGNEESGDGVFQGAVMLVAIYDRALTPAEVLGNFEAWLTPAG